MLRTDEQKSAICNGCSLAKTADLIGDSVVLLIIRDLLTGPMRFGDFEKSLSGISTRTLSNKLRDLESKGLVAKSPTDGDSRGFTYSLTPAGIGLADITHAMREYGEKFL